MKRVCKLVCLLALLSIWPSSLLIAQTSFALTGTIVTARGIVDNETILVVNGRIQDIGTNIVMPEGTPWLKVDGVIFPGLIDLHNHMAWNVLPRWSLPSPVNNRYEWQAMPEYAAHLARPEHEMMARGEGCDMERYAEVKALLGGATSVTGTFASAATDDAKGDATKNDGTKNNCVKGLVRKLDVFSGLYPQGMNVEPLFYEIFPLEIPWQDAQAIRDKLASREVKAVICHVGEGKDASARREFSMFAARGFLRPGVSIIHGVALGESEFRKMAVNGVGFVWSPRSNFELYGKTADVESAKAAQMTMALAPDWSPTGSSGLLDELRYAYKWNADHSKPIFSNSDFFQMLTANPAHLAAVSDRIGSLAPEMAADLIVLPRKGDDPLQALVRSDPASIQLVVVAGHALLGTPDYMRQLHPGKELETVTVCNQQKALDIREDVGDSFAAIEGRLKDALQSLGTSLAPLSECK